MKNVYEISENRLVGSLSFIDLKKLCKDFTTFNASFSITSGENTVHLATTKGSYLRCRHYYYSLNFNGNLKTCDNFFEVAKTLKKWGFNTDCDVIITIHDDNSHDLVELYDGSITHNDYQVCYTNENDYRYKSDCYLSSTDNVWYTSSATLVYADGDYYNEDDSDLFFCNSCGGWHVGDSYDVNTSSGVETWCEACFDNDAFECADCGEYFSDTYMHLIDRPERTVCEVCYEDLYYYCDRCGENVCYEEWDSDAEMCRNCSDGHLVKDYHWHHRHDYVNDNMLFMPKGKMIQLGFARVNDTCGIELEVSKDSKTGQEYTIEQICSLPTLKENEIYFEHDGSLDCGGFEIITGVHTFQSLKEMEWEKILTVLQENGYRSHDGGLCGLHVHIGRQFFGKTENIQMNAIGKIYAFYSLFWNDLVKASRRENFAYCDKAWNISKRELEDGIKHFKLSTKNRFVEKAKRKDGSHHEALNNSNDATFEFRLGRGTLNYKSFMAWIDLTFTIAKHSRSIAIKDMLDCDNWLSGISKDTAFYLKSRHAFENSKVIEKLTTEEVSVCA